MSRVALVDLVATLPLWGGTSTADRARHLQATLDLWLAIDGGTPRPLTGVIDATLCVPDAG